MTGHRPDEGMPVTAPSTDGGSGPEVLALCDARKRFGGVEALRGANLTIHRPGVVHGLAGENGSGKSTLLGILSGQIRADRGTLELSGSDVTLRSPADALRRGIAMVSQEIAVAPHLSVAENILMGRRFAGNAARIRWAASRSRVAQILGDLGLDYDPRWLVARLRPDQRQMVEIARALSMNARVLILDEPTSSLTSAEVEALFASVRRLQAQDVSTIFVSHRLSEFFELVDELTVLRDGLTVASGPVGDFDPDSLVRAMTGDQNSLRHGLGPSGYHPRSAETPAALLVRSLTARGAVDDVNLEVRKGEIVGLAGLGGAGRSELLECLFGARPIDSGTIAIDGRRVALTEPAIAASHGLGFVPPDRKTQGLVLTMTVRDNLTLVSSRHRWRLARPRRSHDDAVAGRLIKELGIRAESQALLAGALSGGNQQKVALGKWLASDSRILLLDEPTRGVDVASKADIHRLLRRAAAGGLALLVSSSENDELLDLCDRIVVMFQGRVTHILDPRTADEAMVARHVGGLP